MAPKTLPEHWKLDVKPMKSKSKPKIINKKGKLVDKRRSEKFRLWYTCVNKTKIMLNLVNRRGQPIKRIRCKKGTRLYDLVKNYFEHSK